MQFYMDGKRIIAYGYRNRVIQTEYGQIVVPYLVQNNSETGICLLDVEFVNPWEMNLEKIGDYLNIYGQKNNMDEKLNILVDYAKTFQKIPVDEFILAYTNISICEYFNEEELSKILIRFLKSPYYIGLDRYPFQAAINLFYSNSPHFSLTKSLTHFEDELINFIELTKKHHLRNISKANKENTDFYLNFLKNSETKINITQLNSYGKVVETCYLSLPGIEINPDILTLAQKWINSDMPLIMWQPNLYSINDLLQIETELEKYKYIYNKLVLRTFNIADKKIFKREEDIYKLIYTLDSWYKNRNRSSFMTIKGLPQISYNEYCKILVKDPRYSSINEVGTEPDYENDYTAVSEYNDNH